MSSIYENANKGKATEIIPVITANEHVTGESRVTPAVKYPPKFDIINAPEFGIEKDRDYNTFPDTSRPSIACPVIIIPDTGLNDKQWGLMMAIDLQKIATVTHYLFIGIGKNAQILNENFTALKNAGKNTNQIMDKNFVATYKQEHLPKGLCEIIATKRAVNQYILPYSSFSNATIVLTQFLYDYVLSYIKEPGSSSVLLTDIIKSQNIGDRIVRSISLQDDFIKTFSKEEDPDDPDINYFKAKDIITKIYMEVLASNTITRDHSLVPFNFLKRQLASNPWTSIMNDPKEERFNPPNKTVYMSEIVNDVDMLEILEDIDNISKINFDINVVEIKGNNKTIQDAKTIKTKTILIRNLNISNGILKLECSKEITIIDSNIKSLDTSGVECEKITIINSNIETIKLKSSKIKLLDITSSSIVLSIHPKELIISNYFNEMTIMGKEFSNESTVLNYIYNKNIELLTIGA